MNRVRYLLPAALVFAAVCPLASAAKAPRPDLKLRVSTYHGYIPLDLTLGGDIKNVDPANYARCIVQEDRTYRTPGGSNIKEREGLLCGDKNSEGAVMSSFELNVEIKEPGIYVYRIILEPAEKGIRRLVGRTYEVRVFRSSLEVGATVERVE